MAKRDRITRADEQARQVLSFPNTCPRAYRNLGPYSKPRAQVRFLDSAEQPDPVAVVTARGGSGCTSTCISAGSITGTRAQHKQCPVLFAPTQPQTAGVPTRRIQRREHRIAVIHAFQGDTGGLLFELTLRLPVGSSFRIDRHFVVLDA